MYNDDDELLDLVDDNDQVMGTVWRGNAYQPGGRRGYFLRAASCFIMNSRGELWIPRRQSNKRIMPGALDFSAGGHVGAGEEYAAGLLREVEEETGIHASLEDLEFVAKQTPTQVPPHFYFQNIYMLRAEAVNGYSHDDFSGFEWLTIDELRKRLQEGELAKDSLLYSLEQLSVYLSQHNRDN